MQIHIGLYAPRGQTQARNCGCRDTVWEAHKEEFSNGVIWRSSRLLERSVGHHWLRCLNVSTGRDDMNAIDFRWWFKKGSLCPWKTMVLYSWPSDNMGLDYAVTLTWEIFLMFNITVMHDPWLDESMDVKPQIQRKRRFRRLTVHYTFLTVWMVSISNSQLVQRSTIVASKEFSNSELWLIERSLSFYFQLENIHKHRCKLST